MDSDYTYPAYYIPRLIFPLLKNEADLVLGNRFKILNLKAMKISHVFGNLVLTKIFNLLFHCKIRDTQTGFRAFRKDLFRNIKFNSKGIFLQTEIIIQAHKLHLRIKEEPIIYRPRIGKSKLNPLRDGFIILFEMIITRLFHFREIKLNEK